MADDSIAKDTNPNSTDRRRQADPNTMISDQCEMAMKHSSVSIRRFRREIVEVGTVSDQPLKVRMYIAYD